MDYKLGLLPPKPGKRRLKMRDFLTGTIPEYPNTADNLRTVDYGLYGNDRFGVCGPTAVANNRRQVTALLTGTMKAPTQDDVFDLYRRSGNPNFDPSTGDGDGGVVMQEMLDALLAGGIGGVKPLAFFEVDVSNEDERRAAISIFGGTLDGVLLQAAQQNQLKNKTWFYQPSQTWGGHAILDGAQSDSGQAVITWDMRVHIDKSFIVHQMQESFVVLWPEHLGNKQFLASFDVYKMAKAFEQMTGRPFPAPLPPITPPTPPTGSWTIKTTVPVTITGTGAKPVVSLPDEPTQPEKPPVEAEKVDAIDPMLLLKIWQIISTLSPALLQTILNLLQQLFGPKK